MACNFGVGDELRVMDICVSDETTEWIIDIQLKVGEMVHLVHDP
jgi:hypothetical protein